MKMKGELDFVVIENIQQLDTVYRHRSQYEKVSAVTMRLKSLARDLQIPVLGLAHINREADKMGETKPKLAHLKDSSSIENDADVVLLMYRENEEKQGAVSIRVAKNRRGEEGDIHFRVNFAQNTFEVV
jgi:replicative DNA helicase